MDDDRSLFSLFETTILNRWLDIEPDDADPVVLAGAMQWVGFEAASASRPHSVSAAVAELLLSGVRHRLPGHPRASAAADGGARALRRCDDQPTTIALLPRHLFSYRWRPADAGPWTTAYHLAWLPVYDYQVVTVSTDRPWRNFGYGDRALGAFPSSEAPLSGAARVIAREWRALGPLGHAPLKSAVPLASPHITEAIVLLADAIAALPAATGEQSDSSTAD